MDRNEHAPGPKITDVCTDQAEILALTITRFIAAGYMTQDVACWDAGHQCAEDALGYVDGPRLVAAMAGVVRALRAEWQRPWQFMPASCCRITQDERSLLRALAQARGTVPAPRAPTTHDLAKEADAPRLAAALKAAAGTLASLGPPLAPPVSRRIVPTILH